MNQFLAQPALVRSGSWVLSGRRDMLAAAAAGDWGLDGYGSGHQALEEKRQKREDASPTCGWRRSGKSCVPGRHGGGIKTLGLTIKRSGTVPQSKPLLLHVNLSHLRALDQKRRKSGFSALDPPDPGGYKPPPSRAGRLRKKPQKRCWEASLKSLDARLRGHSSVLRKFGPKDGLRVRFWFSFSQCGRTD
jgi:hypothetical protein